MTGLVARDEYADGRRVADLEVDEIGDAVARQGDFVWIGRDALRAHQRPKMESSSPMRPPRLQAPRVAPIVPSGAPVRPEALRGCKAMRWCAAAFVASGTDCAGTGLAVRAG